MRNNILSTMSKQLKPLKMAMTYMWIVPYPVKKKTQRHLIEKPLKHVQQMIGWGGCRVMKLIWVIGGGNLENHTKQ